MSGWWAARRQLRQREQALAPAMRSLAASKAGLDARFRQCSPLLLTASGFGLGLAAGRASRRRVRLPLPRLYGLLLANLDKALPLLLAWAMRGGGRPFHPTAKETHDEQEHQ
jgi:hypothetical protein